MFTHLRRMRRTIIRCNSHGIYIKMTHHVSSTPIFVHMAFVCAIFTHVRETKKSVDLMNAAKTASTALSPTVFQLLLVNQLLMLV